VFQVREELENMSCKIKTTCAVTSISSINGGMLVSVVLDQHMYLSSLIIHQCLQLKQMIPNSWEKPAIINGRVIF
jgi:hypothetical protein